MKPHDEKIKMELVARGLLSEDQSQKVEGEMTRSKSTFKESLLKLGLLKEEDVALAEADVLAIPYVNLDEYLIDDELLKLVPEKIARTRQLMPVFRVGRSLTVATSDPLDILALDEARAASGLDVEAVLCTREMIRRSIDQYYGVSGNFAEVVKAMDAPAGAPRGAARPAAGAPAAKAAEEAPVIKLVNLMLVRALDEKASDVHIEPEESLVRVRNRVDGLLRESTTLPKNLHPAIVSRIKIMARLDIAETRKPQDGRIRLKMNDRELDIRLSTFPTTHGENIVMRLLESSKLTVGLPDLGFEPEVLKKFEALIRKAYGMVLVTGPTGAGKTTSLYAAINTINTVEKNIITIEDPVEYQLELVRQTQVNPKAGLTFATGLRSILRQDPDVILVGEIRDAETADIAVQAALTGHLVFSTIHTNDAAGAIARLLDMQIEPFLISSALVGVLAQRLVRSVCGKCREAYVPDETVVASLGLGPGGRKYYRGKGCPVCHGSGYERRTAIFELLVIDEPIRRLILARASAGQIKAQAIQSGLLTLRADGLRKAEKGLTTLEEVLKVTMEED